MDVKSKEERRQRVVEVLNEAREMELYAISQYMNQHYGLDDMDYGELAKNIKLIAIDEMRHAEMFAERIKELSGEPVAGFNEKVQRNQEVDRIFLYNYDLEDNTVDKYNQFVLICRECGDSASVNLFEDIINEEQEHLNYFDNIGKHIEKLGNVYLATIAGTPASTGGYSKSFVDMADEGENQN
jgi:bacterioferritin